MVSWIPHIVHELMNKVCLHTSMVRNMFGCDVQYVICKPPPPPPGKKGETGNIL